MNLIDEYASWAQNYDKFGEITDINESEKNFLSNIFDKYKVESVLDCACGTGPHLYLLSKLGIKVYGSDYSDSMLNICHENLSKAGIDIVTKQADFRYLEKAWNGKFNAVLCIFQFPAIMGFLKVQPPHLFTKPQL